MHLCSFTSSLCSPVLQSPADFFIFGHRCVEAEMHLKVPGDLNLKIPGLDVESLVSAFLSLSCFFFSYVLHLFLSASFLHFFLKSFSSYFSVSVAWFVYLPFSLLSSFLMSFLPSLCCFFALFLSSCCIPFFPSLFHFCLSSLTSSLLSLSPSLFISLLLSFFSFFMWPCYDPSVLPFVLPFFSSLILSFFPPFLHNWFFSGAGGLFPFSNSRDRKGRMPRSEPQRPFISRFLPVFLLCPRFTPSFILLLSSFSPSLLCAAYTPFSLPSFCPYMSTLELSVIKFRWDKVLYVSDWRAENPGKLSQEKFWPEKCHMWLAPPGLSGFQCNGSIHQVQFCSADQPRQPLSAAKMEEETNVRKTLKDQDQWLIAAYNA